MFANIVNTQKKKCIPMAKQAKTPCIATIATHDYSERAEMIKGKKYRFSNTLTRF